MSKHTPGPWYIHDDHEDIVTDRDGLRLACIIGDEKPQRAADARLIAAAPDLLEAAVDLVSRDFGYEGWDDACEQAALKLRAAIAKATGGSND